MAKGIGHTEFIDEVVKRTRELRESRFLSRAQMAKLLGVTAFAYQKYEDRTPLPHFFIEKFCLITGCSIEYFLTGKDTKTKIAPLFELSNRTA
jgi:DNA-binding XRE family transcriptional regulator